MSSPDEQGQTDAADPSDATRMASATQMESSADASGEDRPADPGLEGRTLDEFRVLRKLGVGGMATVYLAEQTSLGRQVAVKVMNPDLTGDPAKTERSLARFRTEAMAAGVLSHPNIVQVYTVGDAGGDEFAGRRLPYIAMEYVPGRNLSQLVKRKGPLELPLALHVMKQSATAMKAAHEAGIIHRDIKPANILVGPRGEVKVADFGLSQIAAGGGRPRTDAAAMTQTGMTVGTPRYMSPEQIEGRELDARSDLYSLGVTFYYLLAGRGPFEAKSPMMVATQHLRDAPPPLRSLRPDVPEEVAALVHGLLGKSPRDRPQSASDVLKALSGLKAGGGETEGSGSFDLSQPSLASGSRAARAKAPRGFVWKAAAAALFVGGVAGWASRPGDPFREGSRVPKAASARDQFKEAMLSESDAGLRAVIRHWPDKTAWVERAEQQLLIRALGDPSRVAEARELVAAMKRSGGERALIGEVAEAVLEASGPNPSAARSMVGAKLSADVDAAVAAGRLNPVWGEMLSRVERELREL